MTQLVKKSPLEEIIHPFEQLKIVSIPTLSFPVNTPGPVVVDRSHSEEEEKRSRVALLQGLRERIPRCSGAGSARYR